MVLSCSPEKKERTARQVQMAVKKIEKIQISDQKRNGNIPVYMAFNDGTKVAFEKGNAYVLCAKGDKMLINEEEKLYLPQVVSLSPSSNVENGVVICRFWNGNPQKLVLVKKAKEYEIYRFEKLAKNVNLSDLYLAEEGDTIFFEQPTKEKGAITGIVTRIGFK